MGYLPDSDQGVLSFAQNMNTYLTANAAAVGISIAQQSAFDTLTTTFANAMTTLQNPATRHGPYIVAKNDARAALVSGENGIRELVNIIQAFPGTTDEARGYLQITIRDTEPTDIPAPSAAPFLAVGDVYSRDVTIVLRESEESTSRAKPAGVAGANIYTFVGDTPPSTIDGYTYYGEATRTTHTVSFPDSLSPGTKVWIICNWKNAKGQTGPLSNPVSTHIGFQGVTAEAA